jgi:hypothetical protein
MSLSFADSVLAKRAEKNWDPINDDLFSDYLYPATEKKVVVFELESENEDQPVTVAQVAESLSPQFVPNLLTILKKQKDVIEEQKDEQPDIKQLKKNFMAAHRHNALFGNQEVKSSKFSSLLK